VIALRRLVKRDSSFVPLLRGKPSNLKGVDKKYGNGFLELKLDNSLFPRWRGLGGGIQL